MFSSGDFGVGMRSSGKVAFFGTGQDASVAQTGVPSAAAAVAGPVPVLGWSGWSPQRRRVRGGTPDQGDAAGDGTSYVNGVPVDLAWGGPHATGTGTAAYLPPDAPDATHTVQETAQVVASDLGTCHGRFGYRKVGWYFPQHGQTVADAGNYDHICDSFMTR